MDSNIVWGVLLGACAAFEAYAVANHQDGDTLSERLRSWFKVSTHTGRVVFTLAWLGLTAWFISHIIYGG